MASSRVVIREGADALRSCLLALDLKSKLRRVKKVLIKPNLRAAAVAGYLPGSITSVRLIEQLVDHLREEGVEVWIGESTSSRGITARAIARSGLHALSQKAKVINLNEESCVAVRTGDDDLKYLEFPRPVLEADFLISMPVMKTHSVTLVSLGLKNMMGSTSEYMPVRIHLKGLDASIALLNKVKRPDLTIVDATTAMEGTGPVLGTSLHLDTVIAGYDPVAVDTVSTRLMGFSPLSVGHIVEAARLGIGSMTSESVDGLLTEHRFRPSRHGFLVDLYAYKWFNLIISLRPAHNFLYGTGYEVTKKLLRLFNPVDRRRRSS